jgi:hypothetical protein
MKASMKIQRGNKEPLIKGETIQLYRSQEKRTNIDLQNTTQKIKDCAARNTLKTGSELWCSRRAGSS